MGDAAGLGFPAPSANPHLPLEALPRLIVPFKRDTYAAVIAAFRGLAARS